MALTGAARYVHKNKKCKSNRKFTFRKLPPEKILKLTPEQLILQFGAFALKSASKYIKTHPTEMELSDAYCTACKALLEAHSKYDPSKRTDFLTYASYWVRARLDDENLKWRHIPLSRRAMQDYMAEKAAFEAYNGERKVESLTEKSRAIYSEMKKEREKFDEVKSEVEIFNKITYLAYLESPVINDSYNSPLLIDSIAETGKPDQEDLSQAEEIREQLKFLIGKLNEREEHIITKRIMSDEPESLAMIGKKFGVSRERIRQLEISVLKKLKLMIENDSALSGYENLLEVRIPTEEKLAEAPSKYEEKRRKNAA